MKDRRTQNLELQRSHQELCHAVASTAGISQSYRDRMTQILSTLAKFDAAVQGYRRDSKVMEASCIGNLRFPPMGLHASELQNQDNLKVHRTPNL